MIDNPRYTTWNTKSCCGCQDCPRPLAPSALRRLWAEPFIINVIQHVGVTRPPRLRLAVRLWPGGYVLEGNGPCVDEPQSETAKFAIEARSKNYREYHHQVAEGHCEAVRCELHLAFQARTPARLRMTSNLASTNCRNLPADSRKVLRPKVAQCSAASTRY